MKYAFILGSNAYITPHGAITYTYGDHTQSFLSIRSIYHDTAAGSHLSIDTDLKDANGLEIKINDNQAATPTSYKVAIERDHILVTSPDGAIVLDVRQLNDESAMALEHNIIAELEVNQPIAVIRIRGDFTLEGMHIEIDNEKLFINNNSIANSVLAGHNNLKFIPSEVVI